MTSPERVVLLHYHLRGGGVTRVLEHQQLVLRDRGIASVVLVGEEPPPGLSHHPVCVVPELAYGNTPTDAERLAAACRHAATTALGGTPDLWHIHNHSLGKNIATPQLTQRLAKDNEALVLQMHDFAEDGRPGNYGLLSKYLGIDSAPLGATLYPQGPRIHYAPINERDERFLCESGFASDRIHRMTNAIHFDTDALAKADAPNLNGQRLHLYPTRAIRRKNIGEFLLWSALGSKDDLFGLTLAPKNPIEQPAYEAWKTFSNSNGLPVKFEFAAEADFLGLMKAASTLVTTSIAEGFGLAFLEPLLIGKPLAGRSLPEITGEFQNSGIDLSALYERLDIPLDWVGYEGFRYRIARRLGNSFRQYGRPVSSKDIDRTCEVAIQDDCIDFARLEGGLQRSIILRLLRDPGLRNEITPSSISNCRTPSSVLETGQSIIKDQYSIDAYGRRLLTAYGEALDGGSGLEGHADAEALLNCFLDPARFFLLRS